MQVDLLLHPLRSELNWPLGQKAPLDLTLPPGEMETAADVGDGGSGGLGRGASRAAAVPFASAASATTLYRSEEHTS